MVFYTGYSIFLLQRRRQTKTPANLGIPTSELMAIGLGTPPDGVVVIGAMHRDLALARHPLDQNTTGSVHLAHPGIRGKNRTSRCGCPTTPQIVALVILRKTSDEGSDGNARSNPVDALRCNSTRTVMICGQKHLVVLERYSRSIMGVRHLPDLMGKYLRAHLAMTNQIQGAGGTLSLIPAQSTSGTGSSSGASAQN
jgi:hypothetical protein